MENKIQNKYHQKEDEECILYYFSVNEPIAEIVVLEYFTIFAKVEKVKNLFEDDFSINYKIEVPVSLIDVQCLLCFMFLNKYITSPASFGVLLADIFRGYDPLLKKTDIEKIFAISFENYKKANPNANIEELDNFESKGRKRIEEYRKHECDVQKVREILKSRISTDKCRAMEKYRKIYPLWAIEEERYYVTHVSIKYIKQYIGDKCPKYLYYYMFENQKKYEKEYEKVILKLKEHGVIKSRWKNEFSLYMLVKSYFSSAIYQYHADWLGKQSLDIYIPEYKIGIEYQGIQHYEEVDVFKGTDGLKETQKRDEIKREKCKQNDITLIEWMYTYKIEDQRLIDIFKELNIEIPQKKDTTTFYKDNMNFLNKEEVEKSKLEIERVCQYDLEGNYIYSYDSVIAAANETGVSKESIRRACLGIRDTGGGYMWRRYNEKEIPYNIVAYSKEQKIKGPRKIMQYSLNGEIITSYNSVSEAVRKTGINSKSIRETAKGKQNHAGGYVWKYVEND